MPTSSSSSHSSLAAPPPETNLFDLTSDDDSFEAASPSPAARVSAAAAPAASLGAGRSPASHGKGGSSTLARRDRNYMAPAAGHRRRKSSFAAGGHARQPSPSITPSRGHNRSPSSALVDSSSSPFELDEDSSHSEDAERQKDHDDDDGDELGLTTAERAEKRKQKQKNMRLDQRLVRHEPVSVSHALSSRREADKNIARQLLINCGLILLWYLFSLSISLYNKWMFDKDRLNFSFPLFTTSTHMLMQFGLASLVLFFFPSLRPNHKRASDRGRSRHEDEPNTTMTKWFYFTRVGPCGAATSLDIGFGNMSLETISLTFYTMCKSSSLAFVLLFAFIFRLETPTWRLVAIIATMTAGVILMVSGEVKFDTGGFFLVISAAFFSGFRWALTQLLLLRNSATSNPFSSIFFLSPVMFITLFAMAVPIEGFGPLFEGLSRLSEKFGPTATPFIVLFPGCIAFCMIASEFALLQRTSVVTLSIAGIFKEVLTISVASVVFDDKLTLVNFVGLVVTLVAIIAYNYVKITKMRADETAKLNREEDEAAVPLQTLNRDRGGDDDDENLGLLHEDSDDEPSPSNNVQNKARNH